MRQRDHGRIETRRGSRGPCRRKERASPAPRRRHAPADGWRRRRSAAACRPRPSISATRSAGERRRPASLRTGTRQASEPSSPITRQPALCRPERHAGVGRGPRERHAVLEGRPERGEALHGLAVLLLVRRTWVAPAGADGRHGSVRKGIVQRTLLPSARHATPCSRQTVSYEWYDETIIEGRLNVHFGP